MKKLLLVVMCLQLSVASALVPVSGATSEIRHTIERFYQSLNANDFESAAQVTTPDWEHVTASGRWLRGQDAVIRDIKGVGPMHRDRFVIEDIQVRRTGQESALVIVTGYKSAADGLGGATEAYDKQISTFVLVHRKSGWLIAHDHTSDGHE